MLCRLFKEAGMGRCDAVEDNHVPTVLERERYCHHGGEGCPIRAVYYARGRRRLALADYLDTWSEPPRSGELAGS